MSEIIIGITCVAFFIVLFVILPCGCVAFLFQSRLEDKRKEHPDKTDKELIEIINDEDRKSRALSLHPFGTNDPWYWNSF